jgi:hypothetical protein
MRAVYRSDGVRYQTITRLQAAAKIEHGESKPKRCTGWAQSIRLGTNKRVSKKMISIGLSVIIEKVNLQK